MKTLPGFAWALVVAFAATAWGQGVQTGALTGTVRDQSGLVLPGATVTATSPALQGAREAVSDANGVYSIPGLPPGVYTVRFGLGGMQPLEITQRVDLGVTARADVTLVLANVAETVQVVAETPSILATVQGGMNIRTEVSDKLATPRTLWGLAELAPGLTDNTPNGTQVTIGGGFAYDNQFMVNGVDIADNIFAQPNNLFIEDAIEEVQVLTSGISAEFGRFGGGVVNAITKSGGNDFSGSGRVNLYSPSWTERTPFERTNNTPRNRDVQQNYEGTVGGPVLRDRLWFFGAGRTQESSSPAPLQDTGIAFSNQATNRRGEIKFTGTFARNHTVLGSYLRNNSEQTQVAIPGSMELSTVITRQLPNDLWVVNYRGTLRQVLVSLQVSRRRFQFLNAGGTETDILRSPFRSRGVLSGVPTNRYYNAPYFDATDPENRNNRQVSGSASWLLTTTRVGSHDLKAGFENYQTTYRGGNSQTATGYVFRSDYLIAGGRPALDAQGRVIPVFQPGVSRVDNWLATRGAVIDIMTNSFYVHDRWTASNRLTFDLGTRFEMVDSDATGDIATVDTRTVVPRLGASYDVTGSGRWIAQATYGHYAGKYTEAIFANNTDVGNPSQIVYGYTGPPGQGVDFVPGFDLGNYTQLITGNFPTANVTFDQGLHSPVSKEITLALATQIGRRAAFRVMYQQRAIGGFIEDYIDDPSPNGKVTVIRNGVNFGTFDKVFWRNSDEPTRKYRAFIFQGNRRFSDRWSFDGSWTLQIRNDGTFEGEAENAPGVPTVIGDYPEYYDLDRTNPDGRLNDFQRHKIRLWTTYTLGLGRAGSVDAGLMYRYNSALTYSLFASGVPTTAIQAARNPGYANYPVTQTVFFGERGTEEFSGSQLVDLAITYGIPVFRDLRPWIKLEGFNIFNNQNLVGHNVQVTPRAGGPVDATGLPLEYTR
ncbi:MAG TPA: TonB-dependent receptor, partial [Vicinamibacterales bacterium]